MESSQSNMEQNEVNQPINQVTQSINPNNQTINGDNQTINGANNPVITTAAEANESESESESEIGSDREPVNQPGAFSTPENVQELNPGSSASRTNGMLMVCC